MAMRPTCDVYGTAYEVKAYKIQLFEIDRDTGEKPDGYFTGKKPDGYFNEWLVDLCPAAFQRLLKKVNTGVTSPTTRATKEKTDG